jgi:hypothetical protein
MNPLAACKSRQDPFARVSGHDREIPPRAFPGKPQLNRFPAHLAICFT